jgi:hypothetical protein
MADREAPPNRQRRAKEDALYRVREAVIPVSRGPRIVQERRYLAERRVSLLWGLLRFWWPVIDADWRALEGQAMRDAENDRSLREPLKPPLYFFGE